MKLYTKEKSYELYNGNMQDLLEVLKPNSIDAIVCDPPYELNFMNKGWDNSGVAFQIKTWKVCLDLLKPGGYLLAFGGTRTYHRIACAIEDAGFEIRDCIMWLYGSGFPKSHNVGLAVDEKLGQESKVIGKVKGAGTTGKNITGNNTFVAKNQYEDGTYDLKQAQNKWSGYGTCLKPAYEPIIMARKPMTQSVADNVLQYGTGAINIDECRVMANDLENCYRKPTEYQDVDKVIGLNGSKIRGSINQDYLKGRFPANVITDGSDEVASGMPDTKSNYNNNEHEKVIHRANADILRYGYKERQDSGFNDEGSAMRYFYSAKATKKDRDEGMNAFEYKRTTDGSIRENKDTARMYGANTSAHKNVHPTVKPVELMQYLVRLVSPKGATILDCFMGSGSTGKAVMFENRERNADYKFIGCELTDEYLPIANARIDYALNKYEYDALEEEKEMRETGQLNLFDFKF